MIRPFNALILSLELHAGGITMPGLCTSCNMWMFWKAAQLTPKYKIAQLTTNFSKGDMLITVTVKSLGDISSVQSTANECVLSKLVSQSFSVQFNAVQWRKNVSEVSSGTAVSNS